MTKTKHSSSRNPSVTWNLSFGQHKEQSCWIFPVVLHYDFRFAVIQAVHVEKAPLSFAHQISAVPPEVLEPDQPIRGQSHILGISGQVVSCTNAVSMFVRVSLLQIQPRVKEEEC